MSFRPEAAFLIEIVLASPTDPCDATQLLDKLRDSFAQQPVAVTPRRVSYRTGTLAPLDPV